jgi:cell division septum initiation protein DivIVA
MPLRPEDIATKEFTTALRGANRDELHAFLRKVAREHRAVFTRAEDAEARLAKVEGRLQQAEDLLRSADGVYRSAQNHLRQLEAERDTALAKVSAEMGRPAGDADLADQVGQHVAELLRRASATAHAIQTEAETRAEESRRQVEQQVALLGQSAKAHADQVHQQADRELREAQQRTAEVLTEADRSAREMRAEAERYSKEVRAGADEEAERRLTAAQEEVDILMAETNQSVERLRATEAQLRAWLESTATSLLQATEVPVDGKVPVDGLPEPAQLAPPPGQLQPAADQLKLLAPP